MGSVGYTDTLSRAKAYASSGGPVFSDIPLYDGSCGFLWLLNRKVTRELSSLEKSRVPSSLHLNRPHEGGQTNQIKILGLI